jgi:uncharacterized membrane protein
MLNPRFRIAATALLVAMLAAAARVLADIPFDMPLAVHFDAAGNADAWAPAWQALSLFPLLSLGVLALLRLLPAIDPRAPNLLRSRPAIQAILLAVLGMLAALHLVLAAKALGIPMPVPRIAATATGLLFIVTGNVMGKLRWNHTVGIRTPWTLANERVWDQTHRFAGRVFVAGGTIMAIAVWRHAAQGHEAALIISGTVLVAVLPVLRSYQLWREHRE